MSSCFSFASLQQANASNFWTQGSTKFDFQVNCAFLFPHFWAKGCLKFFVTLIDIINFSNFEGHLLCPSLQLRNISLYITNSLTAAIWQTFQQEFLNIENTVFRAYSSFCNFKLLYWKASYSHHVAITSQRFLIRRFKVTAA